MHEYHVSITCLERSRKITNNQRPESNYRENADFWVNKTNWHYWQIIFITLSCFRWYQKTSIRCKNRIQSELQPWVTIEKSSKWMNSCQAPKKNFIQFLLIKVKDPLNLIKVWEMCQSNLFIFFSFLSKRHRFVISIAHLPFLIASVCFHWIKAINEMNIWIVR